VNDETVKSDTQMPENEDAAASGTIFFDVTELLVLDLRTGIQRVVREMLEHGLRGAARAPIVPVVAAGGRFHGLSEAGWQRINSPGSGVNEKRITHERGVHPLVWLGKRLAKVHAGLYNELQRLYIARKIRRSARGLYLPEAANIGAGDKVVLLDSFWGGSSALRAARTARQAGARVVLAIHDLIPMSHPQFCDYRLVQKFEPLMTEAVQISDRVLANSEFTAAAVRERYPQVQATAFPLGHDPRHSDSAPANSWPEALWQGEDPVFVIIGSIEPRKGHRSVLDSFERRWARGERDKLLIIGKVGWEVDELMARIDGHKLAGTRLFHVHNAADAMLKEALDRATAGIVASYIEGFGLPLVECLAAGLPVVASDIPVFHEIAGECAIYFEPGDPISLDAAIDRLHGSIAEQVDRVRVFSWPNWREAAEIFFAKVEEPAHTGSQRS
jgi:alpha-1,2-rhamnosyltransferase